MQPHLHACHLLLCQGFTKASPSDPNFMLAAKLKNQLDGELADQTGALCGWDDSILAVSNMCVAHTISLSA